MKGSLTGAGAQRQLCGIKFLQAGRGDVVYEYHKSGLLHSMKALSKYQLYSSSRAPQTVNADDFEGQKVQGKCVDV